MPSKTKLKFTKLLAPVAFVLLLLIFSCAEAHAWYNPSWGYRIKVTVNHSKVNGDVADFPVMVNLNNLGSSFFSHVKSDGSDIVVTDSTGNAPKLARELESINTSAQTGVLWFKAANLYNTSNSDFYIYYGYTSASETNSTSTWKSSYQTVTHFTETPTVSDADSEFQDSTSKNYDAKSKGSMGSSDKVAGIVGNGVDLDGSDDYLDYSHIAAIDGKPKASFSTWFKRANTASTVPLFNKGSMSSIIDFYSSSSSYQLAESASGNYHYVNATNNTNWHYMVAVFNGSASGNSNRFKFYIDGAAQSLTYGSVGTITGGEGFSLYVGYSAAGSYGYAPATFDEVHVSNGTYSAAWIKTEYDNINSPSTFYTVGSEETDGPDVTAPTVSSFSPADGSTAISVSANLVVVFDEAIDIQTGNITIKKSSDDSTVETISVTSGQVTGNGTTTMTIDPSVTLSYDTGYYVHIAATAVDDVAGNSYAGISNTTTWNFTTTCSNIRPGDWYGCNWAKRIKITIDDSKVNGTVANFPVYVDLSNLPDSFFDDVLANGADLRVTKSNGTTEVAREVVWLNRTSNAGELHFVANGSLTNASNSDFYLYYDNPSATEPAEDATYGKETVWVQSYRGVWHMNDTVSSSSTVYDSTSYDHDGTTVGSMTSGDSVTGKLGQSFDFDGTNDYVTLGSPSTLNINNGFTLSSWVKLAALYDSPGGIVSWGEHSSGKRRSLMVWDPASGSSYKAGFSGGWVNLSGTSNLADSNWHYLVTTLSQGYAATIYVDGVLQNSSSLALSTYTYSGTNIGNTQASEFYEGLLDDVRIANAVRNGSWIKTEYNNQSSPSTFYRISIFEEYIDITNPTVSSFLPLDGSTSASASANLVINFDDIVETQTGNIVIKKSSDNSTVETISVSSGQVTGNGTTSITINPSITFNYNNGYYVQVDATAFDDDAGNSYAGISDTTTWNFTTNSWYNDNWSYRIPLTIDADKVNGDLANFPVYVNLSNFNSMTSFFTYVKSDGSDIRVTKADGITEVAREIVAISNTANTGEMHFVANGTLSNSTDTDFFIYYGNSGASEPAESATYGKNNVWVNNYIGVWHMNDSVSSSSTVYDSTSNSIDGTTVGTMTSGDSVTGQMGSAFDFDGTDDYVNLTNAAATQISKGTVSSWFKTSTPGSSYRGIVAKQFAYAAFTETSTLAFFDWGATAVRDTNTDVASGTWKYFDLTFNGTSSAGSLFLDGATTSVSGATWSVNNQTAPLLIAAGATSTQYINAQIDEVRLSSVIRSLPWLVTEYNNQYSPSTFYSLGSNEIGVDTTAPAVSSFSPADGATSASPSADLVINFDDIVETQTGNIVIKQSSNGVTLQTISVSSGYVTGNGTTTITINPPTDLPASMAVYVTIDATCFDDDGGNSYAGISDSTTWNFTTTSAAIEGWYDPSWLYRTKVKVLHSKVNGDVADFPVMVNLNNLGSSFFSHVKSDGSDIVVTNYTGNGTKLARELESINTSAQTGVLWFKAANLYNTSNSDFYIYYGNTSGSETNSTGTWKSSYQSVSHFTETPTASDADSEFQDSTSQNNDAKSKGSMGSSDKVAGQIGNGVDLDGSNDYLDYSNISAIDNKPKASFSTWFKRANTGSTVPLFNKGSSSSVIDMYSNSSQYQLAESSLYSYHNVSATNNTNWHYMVAVFNGSASGNSNRFKFYIDGAAQTLTYSTVGALTGGESANLFVGHTVAGASVYAPAAFDEVHISNGTYSAAWIKTEYDNQYSPNTFYSVSTEETILPDTIDPTVSSFSPVDGSTTVVPSDSLVINFDDIVETQTGNIVIKKSSDDSTIQTIAVGSGYVTGNGTTSITINPPSDLPSGTAVYVNIDATCFDDDAGNSYAGIADTSTWNFTTTSTSNAIFFDMGF